MFDQNVGEAPDVGRSQAPSKSHQLVRLTGNESLIGRHDAGQDVDTDEAGSDCPSNTESGQGIVSQDVDADFEIDRRREYEEQYASYLPLYEHRPFPVERVHPQSFRLSVRRRLQQLELEHLPARTPRIRLRSAC